MVTSHTEEQKTTAHNFMAAAGEFEGLVDQFKAMCVTQFGIDIEQVNEGHVQRLNGAIKHLVPIIEMISFEEADADDGEDED